MRAVSGDKQSFGYLVTKYQQYAYNLAFRIVCDDDDARDVVQESFIKIWKKMKQFDTSTKFSTWMYTIVTNTSIDFLRKAKRREIVSIENLEDRIHSVDSNPETHLDNKETGQLIQLASESLSQKQKLVFALRELQGIGTEEVGEILGLPADSVKSNLYHARKSIREKLQSIFKYERRTI